MSPTISIIIPAYQAEQTIADCLDSILTQSFSDVEVLVVNDGSTDRTAEILARSTDRITVLTQENRGRQAARNRGARHAHGAFLLFCDADIVLQPTFLEKLLRTLNDHPEASFAYSSFHHGNKAFRLWPYSAERLRAMPYIHTTSLIRREQFPGFDPAIKRFMDWDLWLTMLEQGHTGVWVPEYLFTIRRHKGELSQWFPSIALRIPWHWLGIRIRRIEEYRAAEAVIWEKHRLPRPRQERQSSLG